jgi:hypothetical protein
MSLSEASKRAEVQNNSRESPRQIPSQRSAVRDLEEILPEPFSASYRLLVMRDFFGEDADYTKDDATEEQKTSAFVECLTRIKKARDRMDDDEKNVLPLNFPHVVGYLISSAKI